MSKRSLGNSVMNGKGKRLKSSLKKTNAVGQGQGSALRNQTGETPKPGGTTLETVGATKTAAESTADTTNNFTSAIKKAKEAESITDDSATTPIVTKVIPKPKNPLESFNPLKSFYKTQASANLAMKRENLGVTKESQ